MESPASDSQILDDRTKLKLLRQEYKKLEADHQSSVVLNDSLTDELTQLKQTLDALQSQNPSDEHQCGVCPGLKQQIFLLETQIHELNTALSHAKAENVNLSNLQLTMNNQVNELKSNTDFLQTQLNSAQQTIYNLQNPPIPAEIVMHSSDVLHSQQEEEHHLTSSGLGKPPKTDGWVNKMGLFRRNWKNRFFRLRVSPKHGVILSYFKTEFCPPTLALGVFSVPEHSIRIVDDVEKYQRSFVFEIQTQDRLFVCQASSLADRNHWVSTINEAIEWHKSYISAK
ncbi:hypothetical protein RCL1_002069 [Eukaryota sp. TZLM3-RCL]